MRLFDILSSPVMFYDVNLELLLYMFVDGFTNTCFL